MKADGGSILTPSTIYLKTNRLREKSRSRLAFMLVPYKCVILKRISIRLLF